MNSIIKSLVYYSCMLVLMLSIVGQVRAEDSEASSSGYDASSSGPYQSSNGNHAESGEGLKGIMGRIKSLLNFG